MLRSLGMSDVPILHCLANDSEIAANLSDMPYPYPREAAEAVVKAMQDLAVRGEAFAFAVAPNIKGIPTLVGVIYLALDLGNERGELIYWIADHSGGLATQRKQSRRLLGSHLPS